MRATTLLVLTMFTSALLTLGACNKPEGDPRLTEAGELLANKQPEAAASLYGKVFQETKDPRALIGQGLSLRMAKQWEAAVDALTRAQQLAPKQPYALAALVHSQIMLGKVDEARANAQALSGLRSDLPAGPLLEAVLADTQERAAQVRTKLRQVREQRKANSPDAAEAELVLTLSDLNARLGDTQVADRLRAEAKAADMANPDNAVENAKLYLRVGRDAAAERLLALVFEKHPDASSAWGPLSGVAADRGDWRLARAAFDKLPVDRKQTARFALVHGQILLAERKPADATKVLAAGLAAAGEDAELSQKLGVELASALGGSDQTEQARQALTAAQVGTDSAPLLRRKAAKLWTALKEPARAQSLLESLLQDPTEAPRARGRLIELDIESGEPERAVQRARAWHQERPNDPDRAYLVAVALKRGGSSGKAMKQLETLLNQHPDHMGALAMAVELADATGKAEASRSIVEAALKRAPKSTKLRNFASVYYERRQLWAEAEVQLRAWTGMDEQAVEPRLRMGRLALKRGQAERGLKLLRFVQQQKPDDLAVITEVAQAEATAGDRDRAVALYEKLLKRAPNHMAAMNNLAYLYGQSDDTLGKALKLAEQAYKNSPASPAVADTLGWLLHRTGDHSRAVPLLKQAAEANDKRPTPYFHLGMAQLAAGDTDAGRDALRKALKISPTFPEAEQAKKALEAR